MAAATCTGCGADLEAGRSVCASCGALNFAPAGPAAAAPPQPIAPATPPPGFVPPAGFAVRPPGYGPGAAGGFAPAPTPVPSSPRAPRSLGLIVVAAVVAVVALAAVGVVVLRSGSDETASTGAPGSASTAEEGPPVTAPSTPPPTTAPAAPARVPVESAGVSWTMVGRPDTDVVDEPASDGQPLRMESWIAEDLTAPTSSGEGVFSFQLGGQSVSMERCLAYAANAQGGEVIEGPSPLTVAGRSGTMILATVHNGGIEGYVRMAAVPFDDRTVVFMSAVNGDDRAAGEQPFADLIASVRG